METMENSKMLSVEEVCQSTGVRPYVLRFWESEFPELVSSQNELGHRVYGEVEVETILFIKKLLFDDKLSIEKARLKMLEMKKSQDLIHHSSSKFKNSAAGKMEKLSIQKENLRAILENILNSAERMEKMF